MTIAGLPVNPTFVVFSCRLYITTSRRTCSDHGMPALRTPGALYVRLVNEVLPLLEKNWKWKHETDG
jgi:hypothetical protein